MPFCWNGKGIAYVRRDGKQENVFVQPLDGSIANYEWSPDGQGIVLTH